MTGVQTCALPISDFVTLPQTNPPAALAQSAAVGVIAPKCVSIFSITSGCSITATNFNLPPQAQRSKSKSNTRFNIRAQLMRTGALWSAHVACSLVCAVACVFFGTTFALSFAFGASTP